MADRSVGSSIGIRIGEYNFGGWGSFSIGVRDGQTELQGRVNSGFYTGRVTTTISSTGQILGAGIIGIGTPAISPVDAYAGFGANTYGQLYAGGSVTLQRGPIDLDILDFKVGLQPAMEMDLRGPASFSAPPHSSIPLGLNYPTPRFNFVPTDFSLNPFREFNYVGFPDFPTNPALQERIDLNIGRPDQRPGISGNGTYVSPTSEISRNPYDTHYSSPTPTRSPTSPSGLRSEPAQAERENRANQAAAQNYASRGLSRPTGSYVGQETQNQISRDRDSGSNGNYASGTDLATDRANLADRRAALEAGRNPNAANNYAGTSVVSNPSRPSLPDIAAQPNLGGVPIDVANAPATQQSFVDMPNAPENWVSPLNPAVATAPVTARPTPVVNRIAVPTKRPVVVQPVAALQKQEKPTSLAEVWGATQTWGRTLDNAAKAVGRAIEAVAGAIGGFLSAITGNYRTGHDSYGGGGHTGGHNPASDHGISQSEKSSDHKSSWGHPVLLDLSGNGITVDPLSSSSQFLDLDGDGYQHRTAWVGQGTGVLVLDADGDGKISRANEFVFTEWDKSATGDLEAIRNVFDTNHNGKLDAGDARWAEFKVMVDGEMKTLDALGIASIDLMPKGTGQNFADGSAITGLSEFTRTDGSKGTVGDAVLANDPNGYIIKRTNVTSADSTVSEDLLAYNKDGGLAFRNLITRSADGNSVRTQIDDDGNGTFDRSQTDVLEIGTNGVRTRIVSNFNADGSLLNSTKTIRSADGKTITTSVDQDGDGRDDQSEVFVTNVDGSSTTTTKAFSVDGTLIKQVRVTSSADGLSKTTQTDANGDGTFELTLAETTVINVDGGRTKTVATLAADGSPIARIITITSADNRSKTVSYDYSGDGTADEVETTTIEVGANGVITTTVSSLNADGSLRDRAITVTTADGLSQTTSRDLTGDGIIDRISSEVTLVGSDGTRTQTAQEQSENGTLLSKTVKVTSADGKTISVDEDSNGDGAVDTRTSIVIAADGSTTSTQSRFNPDGTLQGKSTSQTSAGGLSTTTTTDVNGDGVIDRITSDVTVTNSDGSRTQTVTMTSGNGTSVGKTITTTSADSLTQSVEQDLNGDGTIDADAIVQIGLNADGSRAQTISRTSGDGTLLSREVTLVSADRKTTTITTDADGDGATDSTVVQLINANGSTTTTTSLTSGNGTLYGRSVATISADGLTKSLSEDLNGDGMIDRTTTDTTVLNANGSKTQTVAVKNGDGSLVRKTIVAVSANGLVKTTSQDIDGNGTIDSALTETSVINADGSTTTTSQQQAGSVNTTKTITTISASGLVSNIQTDIDGDGTIDTVATTSKVLNANGSSVVTSNLKSSSGVLLALSTTTTSADGKSVLTEFDGNGDGAVDTRQSVSLNADGSRTETTSILNTDGSLVSKTTVEVSANGLSKTTAYDYNGDSIVDKTTADITVLNADGSKTNTVIAKGNNGAIIDKVVTTLSADELTRTVDEDLTGDGVADRITATSTTINASGSRQQTLVTKSGDGTLLSKMVTLTSADGKTMTVTTDTDGDGDVDLTDVRVLNVDGSQTVTSTRINATGTLLSKTVTTTSADGLIATRSDDVDGNGVFDTKSTTTTVLHPDGSRTTTSVATDGTTITGRSVTFTSANGLVKSTESDLNGDGIIDTTVWDVTAINADGSVTTTVSDVAGTELVGRTIKTVSANGLTSTVESDLDGNGTIDETVTIAKVLNADGSIVETEFTTNASGIWISKSVNTISADKKLTTIDGDRNGDGLVDWHETSLVNNDGSVSRTVDQFKANGPLMSRAVTNVSANGLSKTTKIDYSGDGIYDLSTNDTTVLNADGSTTRTIVELGANDAPAWRTTTLTSSNELTKTTIWASGTGTPLRSMSDTTILGADGSSVRTVSYNKGDNTLESKTITTVSGDGRTTTLRRDVDGDGKINQEVLTVKNADGSTVQTFTDYGADGATVIDRKTITQSANGLVETTDYDRDGNGVVDTRTVRTSFLNANGSITQTTDTLTASGSNFVLESKAVTDVTADGLTTTTKWDLDGNATFDRSATDVTVLNVDGSKTRTISMFSGATLLSRRQTTTTANGLDVVTLLDSTGSGSYDQKSTDVTKVHTDGSQTRTLANTRLDGSVLSWSVETTSSDARTVTIQEERTGHGQRTRRIVRDYLADGSIVDTASTMDVNGNVTDWTVTSRLADNRYVTIERDANGDGNVDQKEERVQAIDGSVTTTITGFRADKSIANRTVAKTSADGLTTVTEWDLDGEGTFDRKRTTINTYRADGSQLSVATDTDAAGVTVEKTTISISADGKTRTTTKDTNGNGTIDRTETLVAQIDGTTLETVVTTPEGREIKNLVAGEINWIKTIAAKIEATTTLGGLNRTIRYDYDGNGSYEVVMAGVTQVDGSVITTITETNADGSVKARGVMTRTADGLTSILQKDSDNNGQYDHSQAALIRNDGSIAMTTIDRNADGTLKQTVNEIFTASGKVQSSLTSDGQGRKTAETVLELDGSATTTRFDAATGKILSVVREGTLTATLYDPLGTNPWVRVEQKFDAAGKKISEIQYWDDGTRAEVTFDPSTGKEKLTNIYDATGKPKGKITYDYGNTQTWARIEHTFDALGRTIFENNVYDDGTRKAITHDWAQVQPWYQDHQLFNAAGKLATETQYNDNGTRTDYTFNLAMESVEWVSFVDAAGKMTGQIQYDVQNLNPWSRVDRAYDTAGRQTFQNNVSDDGTRYTYTWDQANTLSWQRIEQAYNVANQMTAETVYFDNGTRSQTNIDQANLYWWRSGYYEYNAAGQQTYDQTYNDAGQWYEVFYDVANGQTWRQITRSYNAANQKTSEVNIFDDSTRDENGWDVSNSSNRSWWGVHYDAQGRRNYETIFYDDGSRDENGFDYANTSTLSWWGVHFDAQNRKTSQTDFNDDGTRVNVLYDAANTTNWKQVFNGYDKSGRLSIQNFYHDDGTLSGTIYDTANTQGWSRISYNNDRAGQLFRNVYFDDGRHNQAKFSASGQILAYWTYDNDGDRISTSTGKLHESFGGGALSLNGVDLAGLVPNVLYTAIQSVTQGGGLEDHWDRQKPIILDLNADSNIDLVTLQTPESTNEAGPRFDWDGDGIVNATAWVGPDDGLLVIDLNKNGEAGADNRIEHAEEIAFSLWKSEDERIMELAAQGLTSDGSPIGDLEGLRFAFDTNKDNVLNNRDARWNEFRIWQDTNQNGIADQGELKTMAQAGIILINLMPTLNGAKQFADGSAITGTSSYEMTDGSTRLVADASLAYRPSTIPA